MVSADSGHTTTEIVVAIKAQNNVLEMPFKPDAFQLINYYCFGYQLIIN